MTKVSSRKLRRLVLSALCALVFFIGAVNVQAATYHVSATGSDTNPGTVTQPFRTIARGVSSLTAGDTLYIRGGTWTEQIDMSGKAGTPGKYITMAGYPGERVTINTGNMFAIKGTYSPSNSYFIFENLILDGVNNTVSGVYWTIGGGSHDIIIRNVEIKNWYGGLLIGGDNIQVINCKIHDLRSLTGLPGDRVYGIYFHHGTNGVIEGNDIYNNPGGGMQAYPGPITNLAIRRNKFHNNNSLTSSSLGGLILSGDSGTTVTGVEVSNNVFYNNGSAPTHGYSPGLQIMWNASNNHVWNNTFFGNQGYGLEVGVASAANNVLQNNIVYGNLNPGIHDVGTATIKSHNLTTDPRFINAGAFDFSLQTNSPALDAGVTVSRIITDIRMAPRPQGMSYDIGAYEGGGVSASLSPPRNLRVQ
jgi:hypothetical protein